MDLDSPAVTQLIHELVPSAWHTLEADLDCYEPKEKLTLYLDKSVARTFKAMGKGYQARINRLLQTWLALKAAKALDTHRMMVAHRSEMLDRRRQMEAEGQETDLVLAPGELPPTEEPPEVDW